MAIQEFDKLNILENGLYDVPEKSKRSMPYEQYFGEMYLTEEQVGERIMLAKRIYNPIVLFLLMLMPVLEYGYEMEVAKGLLKSQLATLGVGDDEYRENLANELARSTRDNADDPWFFSDDRAIYVSENESNTVSNRRDFLIAIERGMTQKQWKGINDRRERRTHRILNDTIIPIMEYFNIGKARGLYPKDVDSPYTTLPDRPEELINCRCSAVYLQ